MNSHLMHCVLMGNAVLAGAVMLLLSSTATPHAAPQATVALATQQQMLRAQPAVQQRSQVHTASSNVATDDDNQLQGWNEQPRQPRWVF
ncbi:hypothetical protein IB229_10560 [Pseudomonas sp. PDM14]|uniref:hypothetical protein n=1 Tax=Pseudomonas sp. PDM14 TaxID=2769288 RepID=UPI001781A5D9|nr:hypothetical protein [Pseudomonas sp. PDM14]MBD9483418.1 hypothetical protein [Pseudomonas sp. PDM14]